MSNAKGWEIASVAPEFFENGHLKIERVFEEKRQLQKITFIGIRKWRYAKKKDIVDLWFKVGLRRERE